MTENPDKFDINFAHKLLKYQIWITSKSRTQSEKRCKLLDTLLHISLIFLSLIVIGLSIFGENFFCKETVDELSIMSSVGVLAFSIFVSGFRFGEKAILFRECYLKLDDLEGSGLPYWKMRRKYHDILSAFPNHSSFDYNYFLYTHIYIQKRTITHPRGNDIELGRPKRIKMHMVRNLYFYVPIMLALLTALLLLLLGR